MQNHDAHFRRVSRRSEGLHSSRTQAWQGFQQSVSSGFSMIELLVVVAIVLVVAAFAVPNITTTMASYRVRSALNQSANMALLCRTQAIKNNVTQRLHFSTVNNRVVLWDADAADAAAQPVAGDAQLHAQMWLSPQFSDPGLPTGGPTQLTAQIMWGSNIPTSQINVNSDVYFNSRGMPCIPAAGGGVCGVTNGFVYYFRYTGAGRARWAATSVSPAGRIESWFWNGASWGN